MISTREELKSYREQLEEMKKENAALREKARAQVSTIDAAELELFNRWKKNKSFLESEASKDSISESEQLRVQVAQLTATVRLREQERDAQIERAMASESKKMYANTAFPLSDSHKNDKTEMYEDLTGLLLTDIKRTPESIVYNCLQTGRNGSKLHILVFSFHFVLAS